MRTRDWATVDFYAVLGVAPAASAEEINGAFRALAKRLHPDRVGASSEDGERFKSVTAAYDVLGNMRMRRNYDQVRLEAAPPLRAAPAAGVATTASGSRREAARPRTPEEIRRGARRWTLSGIAILLIGAFVTVLVVRLQIDERARHAGRIKTQAVLLVGASGNEVRFTTATGEVVQAPEPTRVNPGAERDGESLTVLYRPDQPSDVIIDESTAARDITLWIVALKMLVGGAVFLGVGLRRYRRVNAPARATATDGPARAAGPA